jgi:hypothetical protein
MFLQDGDNSSRRIQTVKANVSLQYLCCDVVCFYLPNALQLVRWVRCGCNVPAQRQQQKNTRQSSTCSIEYVHPLQHITTQPFSSGSAPA